MKTSQFVRWSGLAAIVAGTASIVAAFGVGATAPWIYWVSNIASLIALIGIFLHQRESAGTFGLIAFLVAFIGMLFLTFAYQIDIGGMVYAIGLLLLAIAVLRAGSFPKWVPWLWIAAIIVGIPGMFLPDLEQLLFLLGAFFFGGGFIGAGFTLWRG